MIEFIQVDKVYPAKEQGKQALQSISLKIEKGEVFGIVGQSGSGKSTLLRLINQIESQTAGKILIAGQEIEHLNHKDLQTLRQKIGFIFQQFNLLNNLTVRQNVALPLKIQGHSNPQKVGEMLAFVNLESKGEQYPQQLSGGEKQRVAIARALSFAPEILLCDEPTSALDEHHSQEVIALLKKIQREFQTTIVVVSHEFNVIKELCQRAAILAEGQLLEIVDVSPPEVSHVYDSYYERARENLLHG